MNPWSMVLGNLAAKPSTTASVDPRPVERSKPVSVPRPERQKCPHCGAPMKLPDGPKPWTHDEDAVLIEMLEAGRPRLAIAGALKRPPSSIGSRITTLGLKPGRRQS